MVMKNEKLTHHVGLLVSENLHNKLHSLSVYEGRSMNGEIRFIVQRYITAFEKKNGPIDPLPKK